MRVDSPSVLKGNGSIINRDRLPRLGSGIRGVYDLFAANPAQVVAAKHISDTISKLTDFYGMDIRRIGYGRYMLVGEWNGSHYRDFVAERMEREGA